MPLETRDFNLFVLLRRRDDLPEVWFAEIPDIEVAMQGRIPTEAIEAAWEAARMVITHDLDNGIDPLRFCGNSDQCEERTLMARIMTSTPVTMMPIKFLDRFQERLGAMVIQLPIRAMRHIAESPTEASETLGVWPSQADVEPSHAGV